MSINAADVLDAAEAHAADMPRLHSPEDITVGISLGAAMLLFIGCAFGFGLVAYFYLQLSDLCDDLINPYTLCDRINSKLHFEAAAHGAQFLAWLVALHPLGLIFSLLTVVLRALWWQQRKLEVDPTTCYNPRTQSGLRARWAVMAAWHGVVCFYAFVQ